MVRLPANIEVHGAVDSAGRGRQSCARGGGPGPWVAWHNVIQGETFNGPQNTHNTYFRLQLMHVLSHGWTVAFTFVGEAEEEGEIERRLEYRANTANSNA